jgi:hypothetical protein
MAIAKPRVFIVQENDDANVLLNGLLWLKGCESHKFTEGKECLEKMSQFEGKVDVVIIGDNIASDRNLTLITQRFLLLLMRILIKQGYWVMVLMNLVLNL